MLCALALAKGPDAGVHVVFQRDASPIAHMSVRRENQMILPLGAVSTGARAVPGFAVSGHAPRGGATPHVALTAIAVVTVLSGCVTTSRPLFPAERTVCHELFAAAGRPTLFPEPKDVALQREMRKLIFQAEIGGGEISFFGGFPLLLGCTSFDVLPAELQRIAKENGYGPGMPVLLGLSGLPSGFEYHGMVVAKSTDCRGVRPSTLSATSTATDLTQLTTDCADELHPYQLPDATGVLFDATPYRADRGRRARRDGSDAQVFLRTPEGKRIQITSTKKDGPPVLRDTHGSQPIVLNAPREVRGDNVTDVVLERGGPTIAYLEWVTGGHSWNVVRLLHDRTVGPLIGVPATIRLDGLPPDNPQRRTPGRFAASPNGMMLAIALLEPKGQWRIATVGAHDDKEMANMTFDDTGLRDWSTGPPNRKVPDADKADDLTWIADGSSPAFSPDGNRLAVVRQRDGGTHIYVIALDAPESLAQITHGNSIEDEPSWSPDGQYLAFTAAPAEHPDATHLFVARADGRSEATQLTQGSASVATPMWGTDGIYFAANQAGNFDLWRVKPQLEALPITADAGAANEVSKSSTTITVASATEVLRDMKASHDRRRDAATWLGTQGAAAKDSVGMLVEALACDSDALQDAILGSLAMIDAGWRARPEVKSWVATWAKTVRTSSKSYDRKIAAEALGRIGVGAKSALPALRRAAKDRDRAVGDAAMHAIEQITKVP